VNFFRPLDDGMRLIRVLHGSRDIPAVFRREPADQ
jgi:plasmid stabilization system protein ParE